ncbi:MAG: response regulator [Nitrospirae bacterium]|nr:response regulator [Nitrospirota bacterium]
MATILVVEDDEQLRSWLRRLLEDNGYLVFEAGNGSNALACIDREKPDLIVLDIYLPDKDGLETLLQLHKGCQTVKVLAISGKFNAGYGTDALAMLFGAAKTLAKPFTAAVFLEHVEQLLASA